MFDEVENNEEILQEARRLLKIIDKSEITDKKEFLFVLSIKEKIKNNSKISRQELYWLRDIKDSQL